MSVKIQKQLEKLAKNSYSRYSNYSVSAIVIADDGTMFEGVNVENAVYPLGLCAERNAIFSAVTKGYKSFREIHLRTPSEDDSGTPCGSCRQVMVEFMKPDSSIFVYNSLGKTKEYKLKELLPNSFSSSSLVSTVKKGK
jgi:cytidine deaminase